MKKLVKNLSCKLTDPELRKRKEEVLASIKMKVLSKQELSDGYKYEFDGSDTVLDELVSFIKTERLCCDFFHFSIDIAGDGTSSRLSITGPAGAKDFINTELEL